MYREAHVDPGLSAYNRRWQEPREDAPTETQPARGDEDKTSVTLRVWISSFLSRASGFRLLGNLAVDKLHCFLGWYSCQNGLLPAPTSHPSILPDIGTRVALGVIFPPRVCPSVVVAKQRGWLRSSLFHHPSDPSNCHPMCAA